MRFWKIGLPLAGMAAAAFAASVWTGGDSADES